MSSIGRLSFALFLLTLGSAASLAEDTPRVRLVAQPDDPATGLELGETVTPTPQRDRLSMDRFGNVLFTGEVRDSGGATVQVGAIFVARAGELHAIAVPGENAPPEGGLDVTDYWIFEVTDARISIGGNTFVEARIRSDPFINLSHLTGIDGIQRTAVAEHMTLPGVCMLERLGDDSFPEAFALNGEALVFTGRYDDSCPNDDLDAVFRRVAGGDIDEIVRDFGPVPGVPGAWFDEDFRAPLVTEDGAAIFYAPYTDGPSYVRALVVDDPAGSVPRYVAAAAGWMYPGTDTAIDDFRFWTVAPRPAAGEEPRYGFIAVASDSFDSFLVVSDSANGTDAIMATETVGLDAEGDGYIFRATEFTAVSMTLAGADLVVVTGDTEKLGSGVAPGVWRFDPHADDPLQVVLWEGEFVNGLDFELIDQLYTVNVNRDGRIVAEVLLDGSHAILIEDLERSGEFQVGVKQGDDIPTHTGTTELVGIMRSFPPDPVLSGPGLDGRPSRFNERGEFVFEGRAVFPGGGIRSGVYTLSLPGPDACDVEVKVKRGNLIISNGKCDAEVFVHSSGDGNFEVEPGAGTTINGESASWVGSASRNVSISMGAGDDRVGFSTSSVIGQHDVLKNLTVDGGPGSDALNIHAWAVAGSVTVRTGTGETDDVWVTGATVDRHLKVFGGDGVAYVDLVQNHVEGKTTIENGDGDGSDLLVDRCTLWKTTIRGGRGSDSINVLGSHFFAPVKIDAGRGAADRVIVDGGRLQDGGLNINAKKSDYPQVSIEDVDIEGSVNVTTGKGGSDVALRSCNVKYSFSHRTLGSGGAGRENLLEVDDCEFGVWMKVRGKGTHGILVSGCTSVKRGIAINLKGGVFYEVGVWDNDVMDGLLQVQSKAGSFMGQFLRNTVHDGIMTVRTGNGNDVVAIRDCGSAGILQVITSKGDDQVYVNGTVVGGDLRLGGGAGHDLLNNGYDEPNDVGGEVTEDSFEGPLP